MSMDNVNNSLSLSYKISKLDIVEEEGSILTDNKQQAIEMAVEMEVRLEELLDENNRMRRKIAYAHSILKPTQ